MKNLRDNLLSAFIALKRNWLRSGLTMLGIIIGVGSVVLLISIGQGVKMDVGKQIETLGTNVIFVVPGKLEKSGQPNPMATLGISTLTAKDVQSVEKVDGVQVSVPIMFVAGNIDYQKSTYSGIILAASPSISEFFPHKMEEGRFFQSADEGRALCVLSHATKEEMLPHQSAIGKVVKVGTGHFEVVGVLAEEEKSMFGEMSNFSAWNYIPFSSARKFLNGGQINRIFLKTDHEKSPEKVNAAVKSVLLSNHGNREDFGLLTPEKLLGVIFRVFNIVTAMVVGIGAISLVVAGIGIMNIMLVTVTERTREIGIRKTVGARQSDIFIQFLTEAVTMSFIGGTVGTIFATVTCYFVGKFTPIKPFVSIWSILLAFGTCFAVGIVFGVAPALRASKKDPIDALRWE